MDELNVNNEEQEFKIDSDQLANWAFMKIAENDAEVKRLKEQHQVYIKQADEWYQRKASKAIDSSEYLKQKLDEYRQTQPNQKVDVPAGQTIVRHTNKPIYDDVKLTEYVRSNAPEMLKYSVDKTKFKKTIKNVDGKAIDENGQIVDGMHFEQNESVSFKLNK
ncbi:host-nuclease inhibitor Gam family protein [Nicoliella lavandulae]|uniref:Host-nuclease inhibitor Gam family protein n=1 Tax=Nicoliella lavandulae TaxID=3082954 RepID=A0ABU8SMA0_9LACO